MSDLVLVAQPQAAQKVALGAEQNQPVGELNRPRYAHHHERYQQLDSDQQRGQEHGRDVQAQLGQLGADGAFVDVRLQKRHRPFANDDRQQERLGAAGRRPRSLRVQHGIIGAQHRQVGEVGVAVDDALQEFVHGDEFVEWDSERHGVGDLFGGQLAGDLGLAVDFGQQRVLENRCQQVRHDTLAEQQQHRGEGRQAQDDAAEQVALRAVRRRQRLKRGGLAVYGTAARYGG